MPTNFFYIYDGFAVNFGWTWYETPPGRKGSLNKTHQKRTTNYPAPGKRDFKAGLKIWIRGFLSSEWRANDLGRLEGLFQNLHSLADSFKNEFECGVIPRQTHQPINCPHPFSHSFSGITLREYGQFWAGGARDFLRKNTSTVRCKTAHI